MPAAPNAEHERLMLDRLAAMAEMQSSHFWGSSPGRTTGTFGPGSAAAARTGVWAVAVGPGCRDQFLGPCRNRSPHAHGKSRVPGGSQPAVP
jgi:hypothetical protein